MSAAVDQQATGGATAPRWARVRGARIDLTNLERLLCEAPGIEQARVAVLDSARGPLLEAAVVLAPGDGRDGPAVRHDLAQRLHPPMVPLRVAVVDAVDDPPAVPSAAGASTPLGRQVQELWSRSLGRPVGPADDVLALGADLPLAAATAELLAKAWSRPVAASVLLAAPTIEALEQATERPGPWSTAVAIQDRPAASRTLALLYDLDGTAFTLADLGRAVDPDLDVVGFDSPLRWSGAPHGTSIEALVERHVADLLRLRPGRTYLVAGYSNGAAFAYELAHQLTERGQSVEFLGLVDIGPNLTDLRLPWNRAIHPPGAWPWRPPVYAPRHRRLAALWTHATRPGGPGVLSTLIDRFGLGRASRLARARLHLRTRRSLPPHLRSAWCWYLGMDAVTDYRPPAYAGPVDLLVCEQTAKGAFPASPRVDHATRIDPLLGWDRCALGDIRLWPLVGAHADLIEDPYLDGTAAVLRRAIEARGGFEGPR